MQINRRVTNGLAWAGLLLVVGVPSAELISSQFMQGDGAPERASVVSTPADVGERPMLDAVPETDPVQTASIGSDPVENFVGSGRELPSYITDGGTAATAPTRPVAPATTTATTAPANGLSTTTVSRPETQTASVNAVEKIAPIPMPASMRPASVAGSTVPRGMAPNALNQVATVPATTAPAATGASPSGQLFFPQSVQPQATASVPVAPTPVAPVQVNDSPFVPPADVGEAEYYGPDDLEGWESGPLADFLAQRENSDEGYYDEDGFYIEGNSSASFERRYRDGSEIVSVTPIF